jgi:tetratricopeptide (TPR) repeat protein
MKPIRDLSQPFSRGLAFAWLIIVGVPLVASVLLDTPADGLPLLGIVVWIALMRYARRLSPALRADMLTRDGKYTQALDMAERALAVDGEGAWMGPRRLVWLNRRTTALLALGEYDAALGSAIEALVSHADSETISNCAQALVRLNRYEEATRAARLALSLSRERSLTAQTSLAMVMLASERPAEAEALARAAHVDARSLLPLVRPEQYAICLATLSRAERTLGRREEAERRLLELRKSIHKSSFLHAMVMIEEADAHWETEEERARAWGLIFAARGLAPDYTYWFALQPGTFAAFRDDARLTELVAAAERRFAEIATRAPGTEVVEKALAFATRTGTSRPAAQSSREALLAQVFTLGGTFVLLLFWTWHFFLATGA